MAKAPNKRQAASRAKGKERKTSSTKARMAGSSGKFGGANRGAWMQLWTWFHSSRPKGFTRRMRRASARLFGAAKQIPDLIKWFFWVVVGVGVTALLIANVWGRATALEPISVPKALTERGYTSDVAANRLRDAMSKFAAEALNRFTLTQNSQFKGENIALEAEVPNVVVPTTGISLDNVANSIRSFFGIKRRRSISGEIFEENGLLWLRLRLDGEELYSSRSGADQKKPDRLLVNAVPRIFEVIQPYLHASHEPDSDEALKIADGVIARLPGSNENSVWCRILQGAIYAEQKKYARARRSLKKASGFAPHLALPHALLGLVLEREGDHVGAVAKYSEAISIDPHYVRALHGRGNVYRSIGNYDRAISDYTEAIRAETLAGYRDARLAPIYLNRGLAHFSKPDLDRAIADYTEAIRLDRKFARPYHARGNAYRRQGNFDSAIRDYSKAFRHDPSDSGARSNRGFLNYMMGHYSPAASDLAYYVEKDPNYAYAVLWLYLAQARSGNADAPEVLKSNAAKLDESAWPYAVVKLFLDDQTPEETLAAAENDNQRCEAQFYIGQRLLLQGDRAGAIESLQAAAATPPCPEDFLEFIGAEAELKRLAAQ